MSRKPNRYWTKERCVEDALKFTTRSEWQNKSSSAYSIALKNGWLDESCNHMIKLGSRYERLIYAFEFSDKSVYVGLTYNSIKRQQEHLNPSSSKKTAVYQYIEKTNTIPVFLELTKYHNNRIAIIKEAEFLEKYRLSGWNVLNKVKTGSLGGISKWTKDECAEFAMKYCSKVEWQKNHYSSYIAAFKNKWLASCTRHMKRPTVWNKLWTYENCKKLVKPNMKKSEFRKLHSGAYMAAFRNGWLKYLFDSIY
jgi:predicted GIY-YIG superfamily endonuclease